LIEAVPDRTRTDSRPRSVQLGRAMTACVFGAFAIVALAGMQVGLHGDARTTNANPGEPPNPPFLGVGNWPLVTSLMSAVGAPSLWSGRHLA
jgi:hypothetical protein